MRVAQPIELTESEIKTLSSWSRGRRTPTRLMKRAKIILMTAEGEQNKTIAELLGIDARQVARWRQRFVHKRLAGIEKDLPRGRRKASLSGERPAQSVSVNVVRQEAHILKWIAERKPGSFRVVAPIPLSLELSPVQREILDLINQDQASIQGPVEPERVILLWSEGASESTTAQKLGISEAEVRTLRKCWWASTARTAAVEKKLHKAFNDLVSLIFRIPNEEPPSETASNSSADGVRADDANQGKPAEQKELRTATRAVIEILHHKPKVYGINRSNWTLRSLAKAFEKHYDVRISHMTVSRLLKEAGLSWKKSRRVLTSPDPNYREKVELLLNTLQSLKADEDLFFIDELGPLQVKRYGGRSYTPKGATPTHPQNQHSKGSITLYGALSVTTNQVTWFYGKSKDSAGIIDLAEMLFNQYHAKSKIYLTWDAASWHRSDELVQWADNLNTWNSASSAGPIIEFVPLPSSAQFLDVIEAVFSGMKRAVIHNSDYRSEEEMKTAISTHFRERNEFYKHNPKRAGKKIWEIDFFQDHNHIRSGNYREW